MSRVYARGFARPRANMTPMIDVVFLLIIFFMLVAEISRTRTVDLELPRLVESTAEPDFPDNRAVINVVPLERMDELGGAYRLGAAPFGSTPDSLELLAAEVKRGRERQPDLQVLVRAARTEAYDRVHPLLEALARAGVGRVHLVTAPEEGS